MTPSTGIAFGPHKFGVELRINPVEVPHAESAVVDVEDNERGSFVGVGIMRSSDAVDYYPLLTKDVAAALGDGGLVGHNIKSDARKCKDWGVDVKADSLKDDTMLKSYVRNSTKESHGLKELAHEYLRMEWPSYDDMTKPPLGIDTLEAHIEYLRQWTPETAQEHGPNKVYTLDMLPVDLVAAYCGCDCVATWRLNEYFDKNMTPAQKSYYTTLELPTMRLLYRMELEGVVVDVDYLKELRVDFQKDAEMLLSQLLELANARGYVPQHRKNCPKKAHTHEFNPGSPKQVLEALNAFGFRRKVVEDGVERSFPLDGAAKGDLEPFRGDEFVNLLLEYRKVNKVIGTFIDAWLELPTLPKIHTTFSQVSFDEQSGDWKGIRTGRLSSKEPNLQQISKAGDDDQETTGKALRSAFIPDDPEKEMWVYDFDQFQYRILAHYTKEPVLLEAFRKGEDVHEATGKALFGKTSITKQERSIAKNCNFGAVFGAQAEKIAAVANIPLVDAEKFLALYWKRLPGVTYWINRTKMLAHVHKSVKTILGRVIPLPGIDSRNMFDRLHAERTAVNYIIQGSEADIIKLGMLNVDRENFMPRLQVHDELHFFGYPKDRDAHMPRIQQILESTVKLDIPVVAKGGYGPNWFEAK